jgi:hypothetical protein
VPYQIDLERGYLHANCAQVKKFHLLRALVFQGLGFEKYPEINEYLQQYKNHSVPIRHLEGYPFFAGSFKQRVLLTGLRAFLWLKEYLSYKFYSRYVNTKSMQLYGRLPKWTAFNTYRNVLPLSIGSRE